MGNYKTNQIMFWGGTKVSDHNRAPLEVSYERIETKKRMVRGTLRKYVVTQKRTFSTSWENLPTQVVEVVDAGMTGPAMEAFNIANKGAFTMTLRNGLGETEDVTVMISDFSKEIVKRGNTVDLWNVSVQLEEV